MKEAFCAVCQTAVPPRAYKQHISVHASVDSPGLAQQISVFIFQTVNALSIQWGAKNSVVIISALLILVWL